MCLSTIVSTAKGRSTKVMTGYKVMNKGYDVYSDNPDIWYGLFYGLSGYKTNIWYQSGARLKETVYWRSDQSLYEFDCKQEYELGFHIYPTIEDAKKDRDFIANCGYKIVKVEYYGVLAKGTEGRMRVSGLGGVSSFLYAENPQRNVVVARHMKIVGEVKDEN